jgi:hypothetical protein
MRTLVIVAALLAASGAQAGGYRAPRTAWGAPDLNGLWSSSSLTQLERDDAFKSLVVPDAEAKAYEAKHLGKPPEIPNDVLGAADSEFWELNVGLARIRGQVRTSWITSPADGQLPFNAAAKAAHKKRRDLRRTTADDPEARDLGERCMDPSAAGPPLLNGGYNDNLQFVQTRDAVAISVEWDHDVRTIRLAPGAKHPPPSFRQWFGDSIGHWEGDTLVVETTNFTPHEIDAPNGDPAADQRVVERFTRTGPNEIFYEFAVTAPAAFVQTWRGEMILHTAKGPLYEFACHEGNYSLPNILAGARREEAGAVASEPKGE